MTLRLIGLGIALLSAACYGISVVIQAAEARAVPTHDGDRIRLLVRLAGSKRWWAGGAIGLAGWPLQTAALMLAPLALVQPALALAPVIVLILAVKFLGERAGRREIAGVGAIVVGVTILTLFGPAGHHGGTLWVVAAVALALGVVAVLPSSRRSHTTAMSLQLAAAAGLAFAGGGLAAKITADGLSARALGTIGVGLAAALLLASLGVSAEMSAYQRLAANTVAPITFALEIAIPVVLAPWLTGDSGRPVIPSPATLTGLAAVVCGVALVASGAAVSRSLASVGQHAS